MLKRYDSEEDDDDYDDDDDFEGRIKGRKYERALSECMMDDLGDRCFSDSAPNSPEYSSEEEKLEEKMEIEEEKWEEVEKSKDIKK